MAAEKREYILITFILSIISLALIIIAFATENWVEGEATINEEVNTVNYGLFKGTYRFIMSDYQVSNKIYVSCLLDKNVCALSCRTSAEARQTEVEYILNGIPVNQICDSQVKNSTILLSGAVEWINAGVYVTTILFMTIGVILVFVIVKIGFNTYARSPVKPLLGVFGLYIWHGCAVLINLLILILWGANYAANISKNPCFTFFMYSNFTNISSKIGYCYWLILVSMFCHIVSEVVLGIRYWLINRENLRHLPPGPAGQEQIILAR